jgi:signal transduction histidine kinase/DNA-binding response OmpR family regulator/ligand-binding sensor domain-containing protein
MPGMPQTLKNTSIYALCITRENVLWIGALKKGLIQYDLSTASSIQYLSDPDDANSLWDNTILSIKEDRLGDIWVANAVGYCRLDRKGVHYNKITEPFKNTINHSVNQFCEGKDGFIYAGSAYAGIFEIDRSHRRVRNMANRVTGLPAIIPVNKLHIDDQNMLWAGTNGNGLYKINLWNNTVEHNTHNINDPEQLVFTYINGLESTPDQLLWLGTVEGLYTFNKSTTQKQKVLLSQGEDTNGSQNRNITTIYRDQKGWLWVGTYNGLFIGDPKTRTFERLPITQTDRQSGFKYTIHKAFQDHSGVVWLGTNDGLIKVIPSDGPVAKWICYPITEKQGLPNNRVLGIAEDKYHRLWIGSSDGVVLLKNPHDAEKNLPVFKQLSSVLADKEQGDRAKPVFRATDGTMYIGGADGLYFIHEDSIPENTHVPAIVITSFKKFNTDKPDEPAKSIPGIAALDEVHLSYKNNIFTIEFAALDYHAPSQNKFAYRIKGFNDNWIQLGTQHQVTFTNLNPGTYYFTVKGCNNDGIWNEEGVTLKIIITPPWWQTTWAYLAYALIFVTAVFAFIRARTRLLEIRARTLQQAVTSATAQIIEQKEKIEQQTVDLQALERLKWRFYTNITHELRTPLTLMLGPVSTLLKGKTPDAPDFHLLKIAQQNGRKLYRRVSEMLDFSKLETETLVLAEKPAHITSLTSRLVGNFDSHAQFLGINLIHTIEPHPNRTILIDTDKYETIIDNLLSNALKFTTRGGSVYVSLTTPVPDRLLLTVRDNGPGIHPNDLPHVFDRYYQTKFSNTGTEGGTGIGLALCAELAKLFGGTLRVESVQGAGTAFFMEWPVTDVADSEPPKSAWLPMDSEVVSSPAFGQPTIVAASVPRILIVEDNPDLQAFLVHLLSDAYVVQTAPNGEEAIAWLNERPDHPADLILSDIMMPRMDGFALLEYLKADERYSHIPVVLLTARADMSDRLRALRIGVHDYLTKPFEEEELMVRIENLLQRSQIRKVAIADEPEYKPGQMSAADATWLEELATWTQRNLASDLLNVGTLAQQMNLSERQLLRRLRQLTGMSPQQYIQELRLMAARDLLERGAYRTVAEVAYATGFGHPKVFSRAFRARFGRLPSVYI